MLTGLEHIIWMTQLTGARWAQWYQYFLAQVATSLSGIMNMCIPKNTLPHCYNLPWLNKHSCSHWEELTCASRWKSLEIMQMFVKYKCVRNKVILQLCKAKAALFENQYPKRFSRTWRNTRVQFQPFPKVTLLLNPMLTKQNFSLLPASTQPSLLKLMLIQSRPCLSWEHSLQRKSPSLLLALDISKANGLIGFQHKCWCLLLWV